MKIMSQKQRVLNALTKGEALSVKQIASRFGAANPTAIVNTLRQEGFPIYLNSGSNDTRGRARTSKYRLGTASRSVVAAGYKALAQRLV